MGILHIREENPFAEFLKGVSPVVDAWGDRYKERGKANIANEVEEYRKAKAPATVTAKDLLTNGYQYKKATPEMFSDEGFMDWSSGKFTANSPTEELARAYASGTPDFTGFNLNERAEPKDPFAIEPFQYNANTPTARLVQDALPGIAQQMVNTQDSRVNQANAQALADFEATQSVQRADLLKRGADYYGAQGMEELLNKADQKRRLSQINANTPYSELLQAIMETSLKNGDIETAAKLLEGKRPNYGYSTINTGKNTILFGHDSANPGGNTFTTFENSTTPGQDLQYRQFKEGQVHDFARMDKQHQNQLEQIELQARLGNKQAIEAQKQARSNAWAAINGHNGWMKANPMSKPEDSPYYQSSLGAAAYLNSSLGGFSGSGDSGGKQQTSDNVKRKVLTEEEFQSALSEGRRLFPKVSDAKLIEDLKSRGFVIPAIGELRVK